MLFPDGVTRSISWINHDSNSEGSQIEPTWTRSHAKACPTSPATITEGAHQSCDVAGLLTAWLLRPQSAHQIWTASSQWSPPAPGPARSARARPARDPPAAAGSRAPREPQGTRPRQPPPGPGPARAPSLPPERGRAIFSVAGGIPSPSRSAGDAP